MDVLAEFERGKKFIERNPHLNKLNHRQVKAVLLMAEGLNPRQTAKKINVCRKTLWEWRKLPDFQEALRIEKALFLESLTNEVTQLRGDCVELLRESLNNDEISPEKKLDIAFSVLMRLGVGKRYFDTN